MTNCRSSVHQVSQWSQFHLESNSKYQFDSGLKGLQQPAMPRGTERRGYSRQSSHAADDTLPNNNDIKHDIHENASEQRGQHEDPVVDQDHPSVQTATTHTSMTPQETTCRYVSINSFLFLNCLILFSQSILYRLIANSR